MTKIGMKAKENFKAGNYLKEDKFFYAASIHSFYYSCVQTILHILISKYKFNEKTIFQAIRNSGGLNSHDWYRETIFNKCTNYLNEDRALEFHQYISKLKKLRNKADYKNILIKNYDSLEAKKMSERIIKILEELNEV